jgi:hypothetical protein
VSFGDDTPHPDTERAMRNTRCIFEAIELLETYLNEFPEHDQGDIRVYNALGLIKRLLD